jgi:hypothetical protein
VDGSDIFMGEWNGGILGPHGVSVACFLFRCLSSSFVGIMSGMFAVAVSDGSNCNIGVVVCAVKSSNLTSPRTVLVHAINKNPLKTTHQHPPTDPTRLPLLRTPHLHPPKLPRLPPKSTLHLQNQHELRRSQNGGGNLFEITGHEKLES